MAYQAPRGAPGPPQESCPVCEMVLRHQSGCPYKHLSMADAWKEYTRCKECGKRMARTVTNQYTCENGHLWVIGPSNELIMVGG